MIQEFLWSFEILITNVLDIIYSFYFDYIISMSVPFKRRLFSQNSMYNCGVIGIESWTISHTFAVIFAVTVPHPRWQWKRCSGLLSCLIPMIHQFLKQHTLHVPPQCRLAFLLKPTWFLLIQLDPLLATHFC